jgi:hypothetical protein
MDRNWSSTGRSTPGISVRWSPSEHRLVPLDKALVERIRSNILSSTQKPTDTETSTVNNIVTKPTLPKSMVVHRTQMVCCQGSKITQYNTILR